MRKVTHQTISEELSKTVLLPCLFTLRPGAGSSPEPPRIKWTKVWGQRGSDGLQKEQSVLVAKDNVVKVQLFISFFLCWYGSVIFQFLLFPLQFLLLTPIHLITSLSPIPFPISFSSLLNTPITPFSFISNFPFLPVILRYIPVVNYVFSLPSHPPPGEEGLPGSCNTAWLQWEPLQCQPCSDWATLQRLRSVPLRGRSWHQWRAGHSSPGSHRWIPQFTPKAAIVIKSHSC